MKAIEVRELRKSYGDVHAVKGISFDVDEGSFFAFLGPNGAGKSTSISIICSLMERDSGSVTVFGKNPVDSRRDIGVVFQEGTLDQRLTVRENVRVRGSMYGFQKQELKEKVDDALSAADAMDFADRPYGQLSGGQRRRADIARALVHSPRVLFLDEPTSGLDPQTRSHIWSTIRGLNEKGMTIFLTTHYMEEAADADDVVIINKGEIVAHGTPSRLREEYCSDYVVLVPKEMDKVCSMLREKGIAFDAVSDNIRISLDSTIDAIPIVEYVKDDIDSFEVRTGSLDDAFINITGEAME